MADCTWADSVGTMACESGCLMNIVELVQIVVVVAGRNKKKS